MTVKVVLIIYVAVIDFTGPVFGLLVRKWEGSLIEGNHVLRSKVYRFVTAYKSGNYTCHLVYIKLQLKQNIEYGKSFQPHQ